MSARKTTPPRRPTRTALRQELRRLSRHFAEELFETLERFGVWDEIARRERDLRASQAAARAAGGGPRRVRRTEQELGQVCDSVVTALRSVEQPAAISAIAQRLGTSSREIAHPLALLVEEGRVHKTGERRGTRYALPPKRTRAVASRARTAGRSKGRSAPRSRRR